MSSKLRATKHKHDTEDEAAPPAKVAATLEAARPKINAPPAGLQRRCEMWLRK